MSEIPGTLLIVANASLVAFADGVPLSIISSRIVCTSTLASNKLPVNCGTR